MVGLPYSLGEKETLLAARPGGALSGKCTPQ